MEYLIFRVDASPDIGTGHLMRCLALGQAWKDVGGKAIFITACQSEDLIQRLRTENFHTYLIPKQYSLSFDWNQTKNIINNYANALIVLDGYHFDENYQRWLKKSGYKLLVIDDIAQLKHYYADILINQNLHAEELNYSCEPYTKLLLGTKYVLLRREFLQWQGWKRKIPQTASKLLVTLGGSDPDNMTLKVIRALQQIDVEKLEVAVILGACNPYYKEIEDAVCTSKLSIRLENNVTNMPELMAWADIAISSSGCTSWELAFMGLPSIILILTENQRPVAERLDKMCIALNLGWHENISFNEIAQEISNLIITHARRSEMARLGKELIDGLGPVRILNCRNQR